MLGSANSISCANIMLNTAVAESLRIYADRLEKSEDFENDLHIMIQKTIKDHKRIIFNGNGYDDSWIEEATKERGLLNYRTTPDCIPHILDEKNVKMLTSHKVFTKTELESRCEIQLENYNKLIMIEANTMVDMVKKEILPAVSAFASDVASQAIAKKDLNPDLTCGYESKLVTKISLLTDQIDIKVDELEDEAVKVGAIEDVKEAAYEIRDVLLAKMSELRACCDEAEVITSVDYWPFPTYGELLFGVK